MTITGAVILFAVIWFLVLYVALPQGVKTQTDVDEIVPGTPGGAPVEPMIRRKLKWTTAVATVLWAIVMAVVLSGWIDIHDLDFVGFPGALEADAARP